MEPETYSDYVAYYIDYYYYKHPYGPDRCPMCAGDLSQSEIEPSRAMRDEIAETTSGDDGYYINSKASFLYTCNQCRWWCVRDACQFIDRQAVHHFSHDYLIFGMAEKSEPKALSDTPASAQPWLKALDDPDVYDQDVLRCLPRELARFIYKQPDLPESSQPVIKDLSECDRFFAGMKDLIAKRRKKKLHHMEPVRLNPGDRVRISEHVYGAEDEAPLHERIVATRGSIGTVLSSDEYCGGDIQKNIKVKKWSDEGTRYPIKLERVVPASEDELASWRELFIYTRVGCQVGAKRILDVDCLEKITDSKWAEIMDMPDENDPPRVEQPSHVTWDGTSKHGEIKDTPKESSFIGGVKDQAVGKEKKSPKKVTVENYVLKLKDADPGKRIWAMKKLSDVACEHREHLNLITPAVPDIIALLRDPSRQVRSWAARLLGRIGPPADAAVPHLVAALQDQSVTVRECTAYAIGRLGAKANSAIPMLEKSLHDPYEVVRTHAHMALRELQHKNVLSKKIYDDDELVSCKIDDDLLDIHYYEVGWQRAQPHTADRADKTHPEIDAMRQVGEREDKSMESMRLNPGDKVRITQNAWDHDCITIAATEGSIGTVLSHEQYDDLFCKKNAVFPEIWVKHLAWAKKCMEEGTQYPIRFETVVQPSEEFFAREKDPRVHVQCKVGDIQVVHIIFLEKITAA